MSAHLTDKNTRKRLIDSLVPQKVSISVGTIIGRALQTIITPFESLFYTTVDSILHYRRFNFHKLHFNFHSNVSIFTNSVSIL